MPVSAAELKNLAASAHPEVLKQALASLTESEADILLHDWEMSARPEQLEPPGNWQNWLIMAGRGWGKSITGANWVRKQVKTCAVVNLIGATSNDAERIMIVGSSGILKACSNIDRPRYVANKNCLYWPNGARSYVFTADKPDRLRGENHEAIWADELGAWRYTDAWDQAMLGLRVGKNPRALITTTPRPTPLIKSLAKDKTTHVTRGTTYDNKANLSPQFLERIIKKYEGTRLGRQELNGEILDDNPNALWNLTNIDLYRLRTFACEFKRVVIGVDPAVTSNAKSDETGIIVCGLGYDDHGYVMDDLSLIASPDSWARIVVGAHHHHKADKVVAETNNGGDLVEAVLRTVDPNLPYKKVHASRGKAIRAEPIAALYEQGRIHHIGSFPALETQMCDFDPVNIEGSPDRVDALVWCFTELFNGTQFSVTSA